MRMLRRRKHIILLFVILRIQYHDHKRAVVRVFARKTACTGWSKKPTPFVLYGFLYALISSYIDRFSNLFH